MLGLAAHPGPWRRQQRPGHRRTSQSGEGPPACPSHHPPSSRHSLPCPPAQPPRQRRRRHAHPQPVPAAQCLLQRGERRGCLRRWPSGGLSRGTRCTPAGHAWGGGWGSTAPATPHTPAAGRGPPLWPDAVRQLCHCRPVRRGRGRLQLTAVLPRRHCRRPLTPGRPDSCRSHVSPVSSLPPRAWKWRR